MDTLRESGTADVAHLAHMGVRAISCIRQLEQAMTAMLGYADLAQQGPAECPERRTALSHLLVAGQHARALLAEFTRSAARTTWAGTCDRRGAVSPLRPVLEEAVREVSAAVGSEAGIAYRPAPYSLWVRSDPAALLRAMTGVLIHSADVICGRGRVTLCTQVHAKEDAFAPARIEVRAVRMAGESPLLTSWNRRQPPSWLLGSLEASSVLVEDWYETSNGLTGVLLFARGCRPHPRTTSEEAA